MTDDNKNDAPAAASVVTRIVRCPQCGKSSEYSPRNSYRPFCSERCRLIDLGEWAEGSYKVPTAPSEMSPEEFELLQAELERAEVGKDQNDE
ncbi:hypothetical protein BH10BDE1_BH10BDE1_07730 [soil metagenome]